MTHSRVTPQGQAMGHNATRLAALGAKRLEAAGLDAPRGIPRIREEGMCKTCACQPGSVPNGCLQTQMDFLKAVADGVPFLCHSPRDGKFCTGWLQARAEIAANPLPAEVLSLIAKWKCSPPDEAEDNAPPPRDLGDTTNQG